MPAAGDELLGLREKLNVAYAAAPKLDVMASDRNGAVALMGVHPPLHGVNVGDRREVEILAPDKGCELAQKLLAEEWGVAADVWSATSWTELRRDALDAAAALLRGEERVPYVRQALQGAEGPVLAVSDYMRQVPDQIAQWVEQDYSSLGADGFGLSDTRDAARRHFVE